MTGRRVHAFVASDTAEGVTLAREALGTATVLVHTGAAVHSTRPHASGESGDGVKVAADFLALAMADVYFGLGDSTFVGNAAAVGRATTSRLGLRSANGLHVCKPLTDEELEALRQELVASVDVPAQHAAGHVEL